MKLGEATFPVNPRERHVFISPPRLRTQALTEAEIDDEIAELKRLKVEIARRADSVGCSPTIGSVVRYAFRWLRSCY